jgi:putative SOS response-associated peptidase YedK
MGIAGLWSSWKSPKGETVYSYTMLTINAQDHALMRLFHKPADEKRMVVVLAPDSYQSWLEAPEERSMAFMRQLPAELLMAVSAMPLPPTLDKEPLSLTGQTASIQIPD